jgi:Calcium binding
MPKSSIDKAREERIQNEIIVDCYNESERFSGWYCHLEEKLKFPFSALCIATSPVSPLKRGEQVGVMGMFDDGRHEPGEIFVRIRWRGRKMGVPLRQLEGVRVGLESAQAIADWHYWCSRGYLF